MVQKNYLTKVGLAVWLGLSLVACEPQNTPNPKDERNWSEDAGLKATDNILFDGNTIGNGDQELVFIGKQTIPQGTYTLKGWVYVASGSVLTIEPGTIIRGDKQTKSALIVERGGQLMAKGTAEAPIVFTSGEQKGARRPGDWGGIILCGKARNNQTEMQIEGGPRSKHGGDNDADNSGILSYVRIEFAGYPFAADQEINGLTLGSVGSGTQIDHVQVSYCNDDSFEWFGGTVNCDHLIAYHGWDDEFDTDNGYSGHVQFCLSVKNPRIADQSQSNGFESDNCADGSMVTPFTTAVFSNVTFVGPMVSADFQNSTDYINGGEYYPNNGSALGKFQAAMHIRRSSKLSCFNSVAVGYPIGLIIDNQKGNTQGFAKDGEVVLENIWMADMGILGSDFNKVYKDNLMLDYAAGTLDETQESFSSTFFKSSTSNHQAKAAELLLSAPSNLSSVACIPEAASPLLKAASFTHSKLSGFQSVDYVGAFAAGDTWLSGWTNFDPQHAEY